jgi:hypothetical protein
MLNESLFADVSAILCPVQPVSLVEGEILCVCVNATYRISIYMDRFLVKARTGDNTHIGWNFHLESAIDSARTKVLASV